MGSYVPSALRATSSWEGPSRYISHLVYPSETSISVDEEDLTGMGIRCIAIPTKSHTGRAGDASFKAEHIRAGLEMILRSMT